ncbi:MAG: YfbU family protein [Deltaproteobacteria bacterium]|nr:YfbU family protein [Deltaproteobacteria bacterium]MBW2051534.1 YfbU family protein [Deltaproteobacteria bacterium]MBW2139722.1 YfbU family protein [Deltaproteobacteria bacterium]MBW2322523.1 YfbU family protein [Deltaproteobacteria bacterium]
MELTLKEKVFLANQFKILESLYPDEAYIYERHRNALEFGYTLQYDLITEWFSEELSEAACQEVWDILEMHRSLKFAFDRLEDKGEIAEEQILFQGFDGNREAKLMGYADYIINDLGRYSELNRVDLNSHKPCVERYRKMLAEWNQCKDKHFLKQDEILRIISV